MQPAELYEAGKLAEAITAAAEEVRLHPSQTPRRSLLVELLLFAGEWERADRQLDALGQLDAKLLMHVNLLRHLIRAEQARQQLFTEGRMPELLAAPPAYLRDQLRAVVCLRAGQPEEAAQLLAAAEAARPRLGGTCGEQHFEDIRDTDDVTACLFEVLTSTGKYYWVPMASVELLELHPPQRPRDLLWRRAHMIVRGGPDGEVYLPALYPGAAREGDDALRLGRKTEWRGGEGAPVRGAGQRVLDVAGEDIPCLEIRQLTFQAPVSEAASPEEADRGPQAE
jgi:type VI secretion system protein ImpE